MNSLFGPAFFTANRAALQQTVPLIVTGNGLLQRGADSSYGFAQDAGFWYLTGIDEPDMIAVLDGDQSFLIAPIREGVRATFDGAIDSTALASISGIREVLNETDGWQRLSTIVKSNTSVASLLPAPSYIEHYGMYANPARRRLLKRLKSLSKNLEIVDLRAELAHLRMIKQPVELEAMQAAIDITGETIHAITSTDRTTFAYEYELEAEVTRGFRRRGASGHAFEPIVAGGKRACTLHNVANNAALGVDELVILDIGAEYQHYAADISRTISLQAPTTRQQQVYDAVLGVQAYGFKILKPGMTMQEFELNIQESMAEALQKLDLITEPDQASIRRYYPHATSHYMGLNVHDAGDYSLPFVPGIVMTVEPGIYIPEEGIGVRIEDDVLITENGIQILSDAIPRHLE
jgi:Xaa-Pro aminopeptidase